MDCNGLIKYLLNLVKISLLKKTSAGQVTSQQVLLCRIYQQVMPLSMAEAGWSPYWPQDPFAALTQAHSSRHRRGPGP